MVVKKATVMKYLVFLKVALFKVFFLSFDFRFCFIESVKICKDFVHKGFFLFFCFFLC